MTMNILILLGFVIAFGAVIGSFLNVVILRLPAGESIVFPASHCPGCDTKLKWYDNIPLISFILLGRRCRTCRMPISWQYPLVELLMILLSIGLFYFYFISLSFLFHFIFCAGLLAIIFIDFHHQIIPDVISLPGIVIGLLFSLFNPEVNFQDAALGVLFGGGSLYLVAKGYYLLAKRDGMGGGDIKLLAMIGAFLGWQSLPMVVLTSSLTGSIIGIGAMIKQKKGGQSIIPYGPFLALGGLIYLFFREDTYRMLMNIWQ